MKDSKSLQPAWVFCPFFVLSEGSGLWVTEESEERGAWSFGEGQGPLRSQAGGSVQPLESKTVYPARLALPPVAFWPRPASSCRALVCVPSAGPGWKGGWAPVAEATAARNTSWLQFPVSCLF